MHMPHQSRINYIAAILRGRNITCTFICCRALLEAAVFHPPLSASRVLHAYIL